jgi:hypothetical protein
MPAPALNAAVRAALKKDSPPDAWEIIETDQKPKNQRFQSIAMADM